MNMPWKPKRLLKAMMWGMIGTAGAVGSCFLAMQFGNAGMVVYVVLVAFFGISAMVYVSNEEG